VKTKTTWEPAKKGVGVAARERLERIVQVESEEEGSDWHLKPSALGDGVQLDEPRTPPARHILRDFTC